MASGTFQEYALPLSNSGLMRPAIDHEGRIWFGEMGHNLLAVFDPHTQKFQQITPPHGRSGIMGVVVASDDTIWFAEQYANYIGHYFPATGQFQTFPLPILTVPDPGVPGKTLTLPSAPNDLALDQQGNVWFTELNADALGRLNIQSGQTQQYALAKTKITQALNPYGITIDPQGIIWFTEASTNHIGRLDPKQARLGMFQCRDHRYHLWRSQPILMASSGLLRFHLVFSSVSTRKPLHSDHIMHLHLAGCMGSPSRQRSGLGYNYCSERYSKSRSYC